MFIDKFIQLLAICNYLNSVIEGNLGNFEKSNGFSILNNPTRRVPPQRDAAQS
jgi:hypothetical protein